MKHFRAESDRIIDFSTVAFSFACVEIKMSSRLSGQESYRLINLTPPSETDEDENGLEGDLPDLQLVPPQKVKRKIRLKRKERDRRSSSPSPSTASSSNAKAPSSSAIVDVDPCCCCHCQRSGWCATAAASATLAVLAVLLIYFTAASHVRLSNISLDLQNGA